MFNLEILIFKYKIILELSQIIGIFSTSIKAWVMAYLQRVQFGVWLSKNFFLKKDTGFQ